MRNCYIEWLEKTSGGERLTYYIGGSLYEPGCPSRFDLWPLRNAYNQGLVTFTQRRVSRGVGAKNTGSSFAYDVIKLREKSPPEVALSKDTCQPVHLFSSPLDRAAAKAA